MPLVLENVKELMRGLIRSIDRKADFSVSLLEGERPGASVTVNLRKHTTTVFVPAEQIEAAAKFSMHRSTLRTTLKRAIDRMMFEPEAIASTKMLRGTVVEGGFFRTQQGGGRGGRR
jgi:hypothetical protein